VPTRVLIVRHADATYRQPELVSDDGGWLTRKGVGQASELGATVCSEHPVAVYTSTMHRAAQTGGIAGATVGLMPRVIRGLQELEVGDFNGVPDGDPELAAVYTAWFDGDLDREMPGAGTGRDLIRRFRVAIDAVVDAHPNQTVIVISHGGVMSMAVPRLCTNIPDDVARQRYLPNCAIVAVGIDNGTWQLLGDWPGRADWDMT
jgi:broad specificity phosphatase PhoE